MISKYFNEVCLDILDYLYKRSQMANPETTASQFCQLRRRTYCHVKMYFDFLLKEGVIELRKEGVQRFVKLTPKGVELSREVANFLEKVKPLIGGVEKNATTIA